MRSHNNGSELSLDTIPYKGTSDITRKINKTIPVHMTRCWKDTLRAGEITSGRKGDNGLIRSKTRKAMMSWYKVCVCRIRDVTNSNMSFKNWFQRIENTEVDVALKSKVSITWWNLEVTFTSWNKSHDGKKTTLHNLALQILVTFFRNPGPRANPNR